ncbi:MAG: CHRD domain-containing protein [Acidobacteria bacterium]|nr:CHRD domain-containing protein [Acidobacteriota bacterium]MBI3426815.1 CHRD domain-containing protein [Acidobacteriota bacterium]
MRKSGFIASLAAFALLMLASAFTPVQAEVLMANVLGTPLAETPPITTLNASGGFNITINVTRDAAGNITAGTITFIAQVQFPGSVSFNGFHIHEGAAGIAGPVRFNTGLSGTNTRDFASGAGLILPDPVVVTDLAALARLLANPAGFYVNLHSSVNPGGAIRGQFTTLTESLSNTVAMTGAQEVPPITNAEANATGTGTLTFNPTRNALGVINGGNVTFTVDYNFPGATTFTGLHIHEGPAGAAAGVVINTGLNGAASALVSPTGKGLVSITVPITTAAQIGALTRLIANPTGFYVNIHTTLNGGGAVRGQLTSLSRPPVIAQVSKYVLPTGNANATFAMTVTGLDLLNLLASTVQINGQTATAVPDVNTGLITVTVPAASLANAGVLNVQVKAPNGTLSLPLNIPVVPAASLNSQAVAVVDSASFRAGAASESIASAFGTKLASTFATGTGAVLPISLDGTSVYINGVNAPLFFVSPGQINFEVPVSTLSGPGAIVIVAKDGTVSQGQILIGDISPGIFTRLANGQGAPSAVASNDNGVTFTIVMSNADGTPVEISAGNIAVLFGTGLRFKTGDVTATAGGVTGSPSFVGAQGGLVGLDQINFTIPQSLAGKGEMDLVLSLDGKQTNPVRIKVK